MRGNSSWVSTRVFVFMGPNRSRGTESGGIDTGAGVFGGTEDHDGPKMPARGFRGPVMTVVGVVEMVGFWGGKCWFR